jgi:hypothetical protein
MERPTTDPAGTPRPKVLYKRRSEARILLEGISHRFQVSFFHFHVTSCLNVFAPVDLYCSRSFHIISYVLVLATVDLVLLLNQLPCKLSDEVRFTT